MRPTRLPGVVERGANDGVREIYKSPAWRVSPRPYFFTAHTFPSNRTVQRASQNNLAQNEQGLTEIGFCRSHTQRSLFALPSGFYRVQVLGNEKCIVASCLGDTCHAIGATSPVPAQ